MDDFVDRSAKGPDDSTSSEDETDERDDPALVSTSQSSHESTGSAHR